MVRKEFFVQTGRNSGSWRRQAVEAEADLEETNLAVAMTPAMLLGQADDHLKVLGDHYEIVRSLTR